MHAYQQVSGDKAYLYTAICIMKHGDPFQEICINCEIKIAKGDKFKLQLPLSIIIFFIFIFVFYLFLLRFCINMVQPVTRLE